MRAAGTRGRRSGTVVAAVLSVAALACSDSATLMDPDGPNLSKGKGQPKVDVCHYDADMQVWKLLNVGNPALLQAHLAHGDGQPGGDVPGMDGLVFDANCGVTIAIAYIDSDPDDGDGFKDGLDILISKFVDADGSGDVNEGDKIVFGRYPVDLALANEPGQFGETVYTVGAGWTGSVSNSAVNVSSPGGALTFEWVDTELDRFRWEVLEPFTRCNIQDVVEGFRDLIQVATGCAGQPDQPVLDQNFNSTADDAFIDVDILLQPE